MNTKSLDILEYKRVRNMVASFCMSEEGKIFLEERLPFTDIEQIERLKKFSSLWAQCIERGEKVVPQGWQNVAYIFPALLVENATLDVEQIFALSSFCKAAIELPQSIQDLQLKYTIEKDNPLPVLQQPLDAIMRIIDPAGQLRDLPELRAIRASISHMRQDIERLMSSYTHAAELQTALQSTIPAFRDGRQVLAVKANFRGRINGIVHEMSQTGQTVYLEPTDVVQRNNDLIQEEYRLAREIQRILRELTTLIAQWHEQFINAHKRMIFLDAVYAAARWGLENNCVYADTFEQAQYDGCIKNNTQQEKILRLVQARHPLLGINAVPIDVTFLPHTRILILTGPNTGGKTVTLKTVALLSLLNQSGFPVPAAHGTQLPVFDAVFADIGDEQSLDQSLSTFSAHTKNIAYMIQHATGKSLILLDELGSGTDPQEGGALAMAVLDFFIEHNKPIVLVTTHHGVIKHYGYTHEDCTNASVDFDENTLCPTYRIVMGVPGESHALDIAGRNGMQESVLAKARQYLLHESADVSVLIRSLTAKHAEADSLLKEQEAEHMAVREKRRKIDLRELQVKQKELELRQMGYRKTDVFLNESRKQLENLVRELREGEITREKTVKVKEYIASLGEELEKEHADIQNEKDEYTSPANEEFEIDGDAVFIAGAEVIIGMSKQRGMLVRQEKNGTWIVSVGTVKITAKEKDMHLVIRKEAKPLVASVSIELAASSDNNVPAYQLNIRGMRLDEALKALERQLDLAALSGLSEFSIIHGKGNGVLQQGVREYLQHYSQVETCAFARPEDGGTGKTYVKLR